MATNRHLPRRGVLALGIALGGLVTFGGGAALAANVAETFVQDNVRKGLEILNNKALPTDQRRSQFETLLLGLTDMKRIADFTLGNYRKGANPAEVTAFEAAFQNYAVAVYQSYFAKYAGQTLKVTGSQTRSPDDIIVNTDLIDPNDRTGQPPLKVDFRVRTDTGKPVVTDFAVSGLYIAIEEKDQFTSFLGQNNGKIPLLIGHLNDITKQYK